MRRGWWRRHPVTRVMAIGALLGIIAYAFILLSSSHPWRWLDYGFLISAGIGAMAGWGYAYRKGY